MTYGATLGEHLVMAASAKMYYIAIDYNNNESKQRILVPAWPLKSRKSQGTWH